MMIYFYHDGRHSYLALMRLALDRASDLILFPLYTFYWITAFARLSYADTIPQVVLSNLILHRYHLTAGPGCSSIKYQHRSCTRNQSQVPDATAHIGTLLRWNGGDELGNEEVQRLQRELGRRRPVVEYRP